MNKPAQNLPRRLDIKHFRSYLESIPQSELEAHNERDGARYKTEYSAFVDAYKQQVCYLCNTPFQFINRDHPCVHWLLRQGKFKKSDFPLLFHRFGYTQMAAFTRWCANQEQVLSGVNDLEDQQSDRKVFEYTVKWKNVEWTFDCSRKDYEGHAGTRTDFPHFHFQMRIDGRSFINFGDFHIPLSEEDLFRIDLELIAPDLVFTSFGPGSEVMQFASEVDLNEIIANTEVTDDLEKATYRMQTVITTCGDQVDGQTLVSIVRESQRTGETIASLARKHLSASHNIHTVISPGDGMPEIAKRSERKRR